MVIVGDGAVGRGLAVALSISGEEVFLAGPPGTSRRRVTLEAKGLYRGCAAVETGTVRDAPKGAGLICALKAYSIKGAVDGIAAARPGFVASVTNGLGLEELWGRIEPEPAVLTAGFLPDGESVVVSPGHLVAGGDGFIDRLFDKTPLPVRPVADIRLFVNAKWLVNSVINPLGALTGLPNNRLGGAGLGDLVGMLFRELSAVVPESCHAEAGRMLDEILLNSGNLCSMLQDILGGRPTELPWLTGVAEKRLPGGCPTASVLCALVRAKASASLH